jgi:hypothetical protein
MVGNGVSCAFRVGEWDWAIALLDEWLDTDLINAARVEFASDRAIITACRGEDAGPLLASTAPLVDDIADPQYGSYRLFAIAWQAMAGGNFAEAAEAAEGATKRASYFARIALPIAARASLWSGDTDRMAAALARLDEIGVHGDAADNDRTTIRAGLAAREGRTSDALRLYRESRQRWQGLGLAWDDALAAIDMAVLLGPDEPDVQTAAESARETLVRLRAMPFLGRLESAMARAPRATEPV